MFCNKCTSHFDKKSIFDLHLSLVHGEKSETKCEPITCEEMFQEPNCEKVASDLVVDKCIKCEVCSALFKTKRNLKTHVASVHKRKKAFQMQCL